jgi:hypothetical protein
MSTNTPNEYFDFNQFVVERLSTSGSDLSLEESVAAFRAYQAELSSCRQALKPAIEELDSGGGSQLDMKSIIARGKAMLANEGIAE